MSRSELVSIEGITHDVVDLSLRYVEISCGSFNSTVPHLDFRVERSREENVRVIVRPRKGGLVKLPIESLDWLSAFRF